MRVYTILLSAVTPKAFLIPRYQLMLRQMENQYMMSKVSDAQVLWLNIAKYPGAARRNYIDAHIYS